MFLHSLLCSSLYQADLHCRKYNYFFIFLFFCEVLFCTGYLGISSVLCTIVGLTKMKIVRSCNKWTAAAPRKLSFVYTTRARSKMQYFWTECVDLSSSAPENKHLHEGPSNLHQQMWSQHLINMFVKCNILFILVL